MCVTRAPRTAPKLVVGGDRPLWAMEVAGVTWEARLVRVSLPRPNDDSAEVFKVV